MMKAIEATSGVALQKLIFDEWENAIEHAGDDGYMRYEYHVKALDPDVYKKALAYARIMGWA
jgi:hypothetical protein